MKALQISPGAIEAQFYFGFDIMKNIHAPKGIAMVEVVMKGA
jgi:hypothetical protein